jgi:hypothetical protein
LTNDPNSPGPFTPGASAIDTPPVGDVERQAVASLRGYAYHVAAAALAWLDVDENGRIYLEVAEDYATVAQQSLDATQVKDTAGSGSVTLNTEGVRDAVDASARLAEARLCTVMCPSVRTNFWTKSPKSRGHPPVCRRGPDRYTWHDRPFLRHHESDLPEFEQLLFADARRSRAMPRPTSAMLSFAPSAPGLRPCRFGSGDQAMWMVPFFATMVSLGALGVLAACENK